MAGDIEGIQDPLLFQELVQALFIAVRADGFQVVDGSGGDRGNDGYDPAQRALIAIYCPRQPVQKKRLLEKAREDMTKAVRLRDGGQYDIVEWRFVTPRALPEDVQATLREEARRDGLAAVFVSAQHLEDLYLKYPHLRDRFPQLNYPQVAAMLHEIADGVRELRAGSSGPAAPEQDRDAGGQPGPKPEQGEELAFSVGLFPGLVSPELHSLQERLYSGDRNAEYELEQLRLEAVNPIERMAVLMVEVEFLQEARRYGAILPLASEGVELAQVAGALPEGAVFKARLAFAKQMLLGVSILSITDRIGMMAISFLPLVSQEEADAHDRMLATERDAIALLFEQAYRGAVESRNLSAQYTVVLLFAHAVTQRTFVSRYRIASGFGGDLAATEAHARRQIQKAYDIAVLMGRAMNNDVLVGMAYSNFANDLRSFGDYRRAMAHAQRAYKLAEANGDASQLKKTARLIELLEVDLRGEQQADGPGLGPT